MRHLRAARICARGARRWFKQHEIDWQGFLDNGVPAELLSATGDPFALRAVEQAKAEHNG
jgi:hypothetical protein